MANVPRAEQTKCVCPAIRSTPAYDGLRRHRLATAACHLPFVFEVDPRAAAEQLSKFLCDLHIRVPAPFDLFPKSGELVRRYAIASISVDLVEHGVHAQFAKTVPKECPGFLLRHLVAAVRVHVGEELPDESLGLGGELATSQAV